jgi:hypothetical protein
MNLLKLAGAVLVFASTTWAAEFIDCSAVPGWVQEGRSREFVADTLFEYMDGNAEGYLIYGFVRMQGATCKAGEDSILIDVSEMADADAAYGIFAASRDPRVPVISIGAAGQIVPRRATFCKGKYYVELAANSKKDLTTPLQAFAAEIEKRIHGRSSLPEELSWFPAEKLTSARLIPVSVLGLRLLRRGYLAQYEFGKGFIVPEASAESASAVLAKLREGFGRTTPVKVADEAFQAKDQYLGRLCLFRKGRYLGGFANLSDREDATGLATALAARIP